MGRILISKTINAPSNKIFSVLTDFENFPMRLPNHYRSVSIVDILDSGSSNNIIVTVEEDVVLGGSNVHQTTRHFIDRKRRWLKSEILDGDAKGTFVEIKLEPYSQEDSFKSTVSISIDLKLQKMDNMLSSFAKNQIKEEIESRIKEIENLLYKLP